MARDPVRKYSIAAIYRSFGGECADYRTGKQKVRCVFHGDTRPSAQIDFVKQKFTCFACGVNGDALDLLRSQEGLTFSAAVDRAESLAGSEAPPVRVGRTDEPPALFGRPRSGGRRS